MKVSSLFFLLHLISFCIQAQSFVSDTLAEVTITDSKMATKVSQSNKSVLVIDQVALKKYTGLSIAQIIHSQSGVQINGAWSNPSKDQSIYLRGAKNDYTIIMLDGIPLQDPSGIGGAIDLRLLNSSQIERIEIVKGAQTSLYGSDAIAGVINIITNKKQNDGFAGSISASGGSFSSLDGNLNLNYKKGKNTIGGSISGLNTNGISEAKETDNLIFDRDGFQQMNGRFYFESGIGNKFKIKPSMSYSEINGDADAGSYADSKDSYQGTMKSIGLNASLVHQFGTFTIAALRNQSHRIYKSDFGEYEYKGTANTIDMYTDIKAIKNYTLLIGLDFRNQGIKDEQASVINPAINILSPYLSILGRYGKFSMQADARQTFHSVYSKFTFSLNPSLEIVPDLLKWRLSIGNGFKSPSLSQLFGQWGANPNLRPEYGNTFETGLYLRKKNVESNIVYFRRKIHDLIAYTDRYINFDLQQDMGMEAELKLNANKSFSVTSNYTYLDGNFNTRNPSGRDTSYSNLFRRPRHRFTTTFNYLIAKKISLIADWQVNGKTVDLDFSSFPAQNRVLHSFHLLNTSLHFNTTKHHVFLVIYNILNSDFEEVYGYSGRPVSFKIGYGWRWGD